MKDKKTMCGTIRARAVGGRQTGTNSFCLGDIHPQDR